MFAITSTHARYAEAMRTNIVIDDELIDEARRLSGLSTKREVVEAALRHFVAGYHQLDLLKLRGIGWEGQEDDDDRHRIP